jgi:hypothetical protein
MKQHLYYTSSTAYTFPTISTAPLVIGWIKLKRSLHISLYHCYRVIIVETRELSRKKSGQPCEPPDFMKSDALVQSL